MIPFRTQRLATSVVNRILNVHAGLPPQAAPGAPAAPDQLAAGLGLDAQIAQPSAPVDADPMVAESIALGGL